MKLYQRVEVDVELRLKEAIDQLLGNKPVPGLDFDTVRFTKKLYTTNNKKQEIEFPNNFMMIQLKQGAKDFWLAGV